jgi:hypothetical protein
MAFKIRLLVCFLLFGQTLLGSDFSEKQTELLFRSIGHHILLSTKDSTSRVPPVAKSGYLKYRIFFEKKLALVPDSIVEIVRRRLAGNRISSDYIVTITECGNQQTVFGFEAVNYAVDGYPCGGRSYKENCYIIDIEFSRPNEAGTTKYILWALPVLFLLPGFIYIRRRKKKAANNEVQHSLNKKGEDLQPDSDRISIGRYQFQPTLKKLTHGHESHELSDKECKAFSLLASKELVLRDAFMQQLWENEGVIVGNKNLDVLISRLRKKLSGDPAIQIISVPGKGYKLVIN